MLAMEAAPPRKSLLTEYKQLPINILNQINIFILPKN
jgi:hypothetical protein